MSAELRERLAGLSPQKRELLLRRLGRAEAPAAPISAIPRLPRTPGISATYPVSFSQLREWILDRLEPGSPAYNIPGNMRVQGPLSVPVLERSIREIVRRHESLRTTFAAGPEGEPLQIVSPEVRMALPVIDLSGLPEEVRERELDRRLYAEVNTGFDLAAGPLLRATVVRLRPADHAVLFTVHHIVSDGWSMGILTHELGALYQAFAAGAPSPLPELPIQYPDFAAWQRLRLEGEVLEEQLSYWRRQLAGMPPRLDLPADRPRPPVRSGRGASILLVLPDAVVGPLAILAQEEGASLFMALLALFQTLLSRLSGEDDVPVGTYSGNRGRAELEDLIGFFINTLVLRTDLAGEPSFRELLLRVREVTLGAYGHQDIPFERLLDLLQPPRDPSRTPLFQSMLVLQNFPRVATGVAPGVHLETMSVAGEKANFDLTLWLGEMPEGVVGAAEYATDLFEAATIERMTAWLRGLAEAVVADPERPVGSLPLLRPAERAQILEVWSQGEQPTGAEEGEPLLHTLVADQVVRSPGAVAVEGGDGVRLTYAELAERASSLARHLRTLGVGPESRVALAVERSPEMLVGMLAVLEACGAYLPLDPAWPADRLAFMLEDAGASVLLTQERLVGRFAAGATRVVLLDGREREGDGRGAVGEGAPENAAYVIYTSGSTGRPKGVVVSHRSIASYTRSALARYAIGPADRVLQFASVSFDTSAEEIYPALAAGATLVLRPDDMAVAIPHFVRELDRLGITVLDLPTAFWHELVAGLEAEDLQLPPRLRLVILGGEEALADRLAAWRWRTGPSVRLVNTYGPTEATIVATHRDLAGVDAAAGVPIGRPIPGARVYVVDRSFEPVPPGVPGELLLGGVGLARGYLGRPDVTAERFVPDPFGGAPGARLYRTGDLARFRRDGDLMFGGRADRQVKLRGYRIEPGEIEAALRQHPALHDAAVDLRGAGDDKRLIAWVVAREGTEAPGSPELRAFLRERLPEPMLPAVFVPLAALPITPGGKVDRRTLAEPTGTRPDLQAGYVEPGTVLERTVAGIFQELLRVDRVGLHDNFFDLGGHSLLVVRAHQKLREALGRDLSVVDLFRFPTVAALARHLGREEGKPSFERVQTLADQQKAAQKSAQLRQKQAMERLRRSR